MSRENEEAPPVNAVTAAPNNCELKFKDHLHNGFYFTDTGKKIFLTNEVLGKGAFGEVRIAVMEGIELALKVSLQSPKDPQLSKALREARVVQALSGKRYFPKYYCTTIVSDGCLLLMDRAGMTLSDTMKIRRYMTINACTRYSYQIASALKCLHSSQLCHFDVKCANICVQKVDQNAIVMLDFGLVLCGKNKELPLIDERRGTLRWFAPEQLYYGPTSYGQDVWAAGLIAYEMYTNRPLHRAKNDKELYRLLDSFDLLPERPNCTMKQSFKRFVARNEPIPKTTVSEYMNARRAAGEDSAERAYIDVVVKLLNPSIDDRPTAALAKVFWFDCMNTFFPTDAIAAL